MTSPKVSIVCNTYNHEKYIRDALESFINQTTDFDYEILVHDDASTDATANIVKEYENKYPDLVKPIFQFENKYSKGVSIMDIQLKRARGEYIACCEGDDYWLDSNKLQLQYDILENNPNIDMVAHGVYKVDENTKRKVGKITPTMEERILSANEVISGGGGYLGTNSLFFRKNLLIPKPPLREKMELDYTLQIVGALRGGIYYIPKMMSAYRVLSKGSWSSRMNENIEQYFHFQKKMIEMLEYLNSMTHYDYKDEIDVVIKKIEFDKYLLLHDIKSLKSERYKDFYNDLSILNRIKIYIKKYFYFIESKESFK